MEVAFGSFAAASRNAVAVLTMSRSARIVAICEMLAPDGMMTLVSSFPSPM